MKYRAKTVLFAGWEVDDAKAYINQHSLSSDDVAIIKSKGQITVRIRDGKEVKLG